MKTRRIGIIAYDGVQALDVVGPADTFSTANGIVAGGAPAYQIVVIGPRKGPAVSESGVAIYCEATFAEPGLLDTIVVPGGKSLRLDGKVRAQISKCVADVSARARRVVSVCTGVYALAEAGLLQGRAATTHWRFARDVQQKCHEARVNEDAIFVKDGKYYTSAGVTAGIDLCLALIEEDFGKDVAMQTARELVVYLKRSGGQRQYSQPLVLQTEAEGRFGDLAPWIRGNLREELTVETIAERVNLSPRHLTRKFKSAFGVTPADFVEELRLDEARWLLVNAADSIERVSEEVGYASSDSFRRAFERYFGVTPGEYRRRFGAA